MDADGVTACDKEVIPIELFGEAGSTVREYEMPLAPSKDPVS